MTAGTLADNGWHHVGFSIDREGQAVVYIDGLAVRAATSTKDRNIAPTTPFYMGRANSSPTASNLRGRIDEIRVYHYAVGPEDLRNQYANSDYGGSATYENGFYNQVLADGTFSYQYDAEGNRLTRLNLPGMGNDTYTWDHRNRLVKTVRTSPREIVQFDFESSSPLMIDALANAQDGTLENGAAMVSSSSHGGHSYAVQLDGINDFGIAGIQDWFKAQPEGLTLSAWIRPESKAGANGIFAFGGTATNEVGYSLTLNSTTNQFSFTINDGTDSAQSLSYTHGSSLLNAWHHVAVTVDPACDRLDLFLNGTSVANLSTRLGQYALRGIHL